MGGRTRDRSGFTLIEVMAVVAMIGVVFFVALNFYTDLARASARASDYTRGIRRATAILDRVARDLEGTFLLVKPPEVDPIAFPWIFLGETRLGGDASERLKFITRNNNPTRTDSAETNLATVAYLVESQPDDSVAVYRWSSPHLPESLDKTFPREDDPGTFLLAEGLASFGFQFLDEDGELRSDWDSSTLLESSSLPLAVDIRISLVDDVTSDEEAPPVYERRVLIPVRPLDLVALADPNNPIFGSGEEEKGEKEKDGDEDGEDEETAGKPGQCTNADAFPRSLPDSASTNAKLCVGLALSAPDMAFTPNDYRYLPQECKEIVNPKCR